ncbi:MAG: choice-of-anchor J domain-containing protein [Bacteroidales bacterium]
MKRFLFYLMAIIFAVQGWAQMPATLPYSCDFETQAEVAEWTISNSTSTNGWAYGTAASGGVITNNSLFISNDGSSYSFTAASAGTVTASRRFISQGAVNYQLSFDLNIQGNTPFAFVKVYVLPKDSIYNGVSGTSVPFFGVSGFTSPYLLSKKGNNNFFTFMSERVYCDIPNTIMGNVGDTMQVVFVWVNGVSGTQPPAAIDNLSINYTTCEPPTVLTIPSSTVTDVSAIVNWTAASANTSFTIEYKKASQTWAQAQAIQNASSGLMLTSLDPNTEYNVRLLADCFGVESIYVLSNFKTLCGNITSYPWFEGFENTWAPISGLSNATTPTDCWININGGASTSYLWRSSTNTTVPSYVRTGSGAAQFNGENNSGVMGDYLITPVFTLMGNEKINFWAKGYSSTTKYNETIWIKLYNVTQNGDIQSHADTTLFVDLAFINDTNQYTWNNYEYSLSNFTGSYRIIFARIGAKPGYYFQMDDLTISQEGVCANPYNIKASNPHSTSVDISFTPAKPTDNSWVIYYNNVSTSVWDSALCNSSTNFTLTGLNPNTKYAFAIRTQCSSNLSDLSPVRYFQTTCADISTLPWSDSFDSYGTGTTIFPQCWESHTTYSYYPYINSSNVSSSPGVMYFYTGSTVGNFNIAVTPRFASSIPLNTLQVKLKYRNSNANHILYVGVMTDASDPSTFVLVDSLINPTTSTYYDYILPLINYSGSGQYIAFKVEHNGSSQYAWVDDLIVEEIPNCQPPTVFSANNVTSSTVDIVWTPADVNHSMWYLYYKESTATNYDSVLVTAMPEQHLTGLIPNTTYDYYLVTFCGNEYSPASFSGSFTTTCFGISAFPYYESFDTYGTGTGSYPTCWMRNSSLSNAPYVNSTNNTPPGSLYFLTAAGNRTVAIMVIDSVTPINTLRVKFNMRYSSVAPKLQVGVMTDPNDFSTFVPVGTKQMLNQANVWEEKEVLFDNYTGNGRFIAFVSSETVASNFYMDDLVVDYIPLCKKPTNLTVTNIGLNDVTITWTEGSVGDLAWFVFYKGVNDSDWDSVYVSGTPTYYLTNLNSGSQYEIYVKTDCGFDYSEPSLRPYFFSTLCGAISSLPYNEPFDNWGTTATYPMCWSKNSSSYSYPSIYPTYKSSPGSLRFYSYSSYPINTAILPVVDNSININTLMVKFSLYYSSLTNTLPIQVGVMTDTTDLTTFVPVGTPQTISATNTWEEKIVMLNTYVGQGKYIAFQANNSSTTVKYVYMDDVVIEVIPSCQRPISVTVSNITTNSADISWVPDSPSDVNFKVYYKKSFGSDWDSVMVSDTIVTLVNIDHSTNYDIEIRTQCSDGSYSDGLTEYFMSACGDISSIPYYESFDNWGTGTGKYPNCWTKNSITSTYPYINTTSYSSPGSLYFYSTAGNRTTAILPAIDINIPINTLMLKFKMQYTSINDGLQVGIMSDTTDISSFTPIGIKQNISTVGIWENKEVSLNDYIGSGRYIAIMSYDTVSTNTNIDDLVVDYIPNCANPTDLFVDNITVNSAVINWKNGNNYDNAWWLYYKESTDTDYDSIYVTNNPYTLQSLNVNTYYDYYIVTDCFVQLSSPSVNGKFKTACLPITSIPYNENFDTYGTALGTKPDCWSFPVLYNQYPSIVAANPVSSPASLRFQSLTTRATYAISPQLSHDINALSVKFSLKAESITSSGTITVGVMSDPNDISTFEAVEVIQPTDINFNNYEVSFGGTNLSGQNNYIAFKHDSKSSSYYFWLDDVVIDSIPSCVKPSKLHVNSLTSTSAEIAWTNGNVGNTAWKLYYKPTTAMGYDSVSITTPSPYNLTGLIPQTEYQYYMRTDCGTEVSDATVIHNFTTPCAEITTLPWVETFETYGSGTTAYPTCWSKITTYSTYPYINTSGFSGNGLYFYATLNTYNIGITPPFDSSLPMNTLRVNFKYKNTNLLDTLKVGVMSNPSDESTWVEIARVGASATSTWYDYEVRFNDYSGTANYIAFRLDYDNRTTLGYLDNVEVSLIPSCSAPTNLVVSNFDTNQVDISWTNGDANDNAWWLYYKTSSNLFYDSVYITSPSPYTLTNLTPSTEYSIYMRTDCGTKLSEESLVSSFYTACPSVSTFPWTEGFDNSWINTVGVSNAETPNNCWVNINAGASLTYKWRATTAANYVRTGTGAAQLYASNNVMSDYLFTPKFNFTGNERIRFWYKGYQSTSLYPENIWIKAYNVTANGDIDNASDTTLLVTLDFLTDTNCYTWKEYELDLTSLVGEYRIAFVRDSNNKIGYYFNIDDMTIDAQPSCKRPTNLTATNVQHTTATISWTSPSATQTAWILYYQDVNSSTYDSVIVNNATTYTLTNLNNATTYGYVMAALCGTDISELTNPLFFTTLCSPITNFPWMEGFENTWVNGVGVSNEMVPNTCWVNINGGASTTYKWRTITTAANVRTGSGAAQLYATNQAMGDYLMTPIITFTGNEQLIFWGKGYSSSTNYPENIWVKAYNVTLNGEINSYSDTTLFTNVAFINDTNQYTWKEYEIPLTGLVGDYRLVFGRDNSIGYYYQIDDLIVDVIPACPRPVSVTTSNITQTSVELSWTPGNASDAAWKIYYRVSGLMNWDSVLVTSNPYVLSGLSNSSSYDIGIATDCGTGAFSNVRTTTFRTLCGAITTLPWSDNFDSYGTGTSVFPTCWTRNTTVTDRPYVNTAGASAPGCLYFYTATAGTYNIAATPAFDPSISISTLRATFKYKSTNSVDQLLVGIMTDPSVESSFVSIDTITAPSTGVWYDDTVSFSTYTGSGQYIAFRLNHPGSATYARIDDLVVSYDFVCNVPTALTVTNITSTSADISWTPGGNETAWQIKQGSSGTPINLTNNSYQATGLTPNTNYTYYVRSDCGNSMYSSWSSVTFLIPALPVDPQVSTSPVTVFNHNSATFTGSYTAGTDAITAIGFDYKEQVASTWTNTPITPVASPFTFNANSLTPNTTYQVRAFATTASGTFYGDTSTFTTNQLLPPTVATTNVVVNNGAKTATFQGTTDPGTEAIIARGFEYKYDTSSWTNAIDLTASGSTSISATATGLIIANYHVRAYAETNSGKTYGDVLDFVITSSIDDINKDNLNVNLYPNPASNNTTLSIKGVNGKVKMSITDVQGRSVSTIERESSNGEVKHSINLEAYAKGVYYIRIQSSNSIKTQKLIVQ